MNVHVYVIGNRLGGDVEEETELVGSSWNAMDDHVTDQQMLFSTHLACRATFLRTVNDDETCLMASHMRVRLALKHAD